MIEELFTGDELIDELSQTWRVVDRDSRVAELFCESQGSTKWIHADEDGPYGTYFLPSGFTMVKAKKHALCTCGGAKLRYPSHSEWCDTNPAAPPPWSNKTTKLF